MEMKWTSRLVTDTKGDAAELLRRAAAYEN